MPMSEEAIKERRAYHNKWNKEHADKVKQYNAKYWEKKAAEKNKEKDSENNEHDTD